uniref:Ribosomal RNA small subunit methyltransferase H n=1 Tax=Desulfobacca acetoxidans TaxID=60893 RepID=A0A7V4LD03_9BACT
MVREVLEGLAVRPDRLYVDGTVGEGGHAVAILSRITQGGELWGFDRDPMVLQAAAARLAPFTSRFCLFQKSYAQLGEVLADAGREGADGILLDLGLSSYLLESSGRGFSFQRDEPLDMRFDPGAPGPTAAHLLNTLPPVELERILREWGEEPRARLITRNIVAARQRTPFATTRQLVAAVGAGGRSRRHPATRVFQALRVAVNGELDELARFFAGVPRWLRPGGRLVIISYHSLEDRLVKQQLLALEKAGVMWRLTKKPLTPPVAETRSNPRARSAKLRVGERI